MVSRPIKKKNNPKGSAQKRSANAAAVKRHVSKHSARPHGRNAAAKTERHGAAGSHSKPAPHTTQQHGKKEIKADAASKQPKKNPAIMPPEVVKVEIDRLVNNLSATEYLRKNVSKTSVEVISMLVTPKTDEYLAEQLGMKINAVRRVLNIMQGYGITNYYVSKNTKGWLSFAWYINTSKLGPFLDHVMELEREKVVVNNNCNDYFICNSCYDTDKLLYTFDAAFESSFKCSCGKSLSRVEKDKAEALITTS